MPTEQSTAAAALAWWRDRPVLGDSVLVLFLLALTIFMGAGTSGSVGLFLTFLQVLPLLLRRVVPFLVALGVAAACLLQVILTNDPLPANVVVVVVIYTASSLAAAQWQRWTVLGLGVAGAAIASIDWLRVPAEFDYSGPSLAYTAIFFAFLVMVVLVAFGLGDVARRRRQVLERLREQNEALARDREQRTRLAAQDERASIAREMHDIVAHSLAVVVVQADGGAYAARAALERLAGEAPAGDPEARTGSEQVGSERADGSADDGAGVTAEIGAEYRAEYRGLEHAATTLETVAATARAALADTRRLVGVLRDDKRAAEYAPQQSLLHLGDLLDGVRNTGVVVRDSVQGRIDDLPPPVDLAAYRVVQESLTNVLKHAGPGAEVLVDVTRTPAMLVVRVSDDGRGPGAADGHGNGILGMRERVQVLGGTLFSGPRAGRGFEVVASMPVRSEDDR